MTKVVLIWLVGFSIYLVVKIFFSKYFNKKRYMTVTHELRRVKKFNKSFRDSYNNKTSL